MSLRTAITSVLRQYARFTGRARNAEFWWWALVVTLASLAATVADRALGATPSDTAGPIATAVALAVLLPSLAVTARRLHDTNRSGWQMLWALVPVLGWILMLSWCVQDSADEPNDFGPSPRATYGRAPAAPARTR